MNQADWDTDAVRDAARSFTVEHLAADEGVLVVNETGLAKKGVRSAGAQRQYTVTTGKIDQVGVSLAYASVAGRALIDRELYLPTSWTEDAERRADARIGQDVVFATH
ncbi:transposase [Streptomyces sp. NPDC051132]|uniref:transposase n=1 Tax=unclassified Streptomyces TaxID=2593676 RepID=UPI00342C9576